MRDDLRSVLELMREFRVRSLTRGDLSIELHETAFFVVPTDTGEGADKRAPSFMEPESTCSCGHALVTEHNEHGCLHGCSMGACVPKQDDDDSDAEE